MPEKALALWKGFFLKGSVTFLVLQVTDFMEQVLSARRCAQDLALGPRR